MKGRTEGVNERARRDCNCCSYGEKGVKVGWAGCAEASRPVHGMGLPGYPLPAYEFMQLGFYRIRNIDVPIRGNCHVMGLTEFAKAFTWLAGGRNRLALII